MSGRRDPHGPRKDARSHGGRPAGGPKPVPDLLSRIRELESRVEGLAAENEQLRERRTKTRVLQSARQLQAALDAIRDAICLLDWQGRILRCNRTFETFVGKPSEEILGRFYPEVMRLIPAFVEASPIERAWQLRARVGIDFAVEDRWFHVTTDPLLDERGESGGAVCVIRDMTVRKETEQELRESQRRLLLSMGQIPAILWTTDTQLRFTSSNGAALATLGLAPDQVKGTDLFEFFQTDDREFPAIAAHRRALAGEAAAYDFAWGGRIWRSRVEPLRDPEGTIVGTAGVAQDVTDSVRMEQALRDSELKFRTTMEQVPAIVWTTDRDLRITSSFGRGLLALGRQPNGSLGETIGQSVGNEDPSYLPNAMHLRALAGEPVNYEMEFGKRSWTTHIEPLRDAQGAIVGTIGVTLDNTERTRAERALTESENNLRRVFDAAPVGISLVSEDRRYVAVNVALCRMLGYSQEELIGKSFLEVTHPEDFSLSIDLERRGRAPSAEGVTLEKRYVRKTGEVIWARLSVRAIYDAKGRFQHWLTMTEEITRRKQLEDQLRQSYKMEALGRFAGGVAHDFNNLLAAIKGYTDLVARGREADEALVRDVEEIRGVIARASDLTRQLLAIGRPKPLHARPIDLGEVVAQVASVVRHLVGEAIAVEVSSDSPLRAVTADTGQIEQVVMNLAANARDAMPSGGTLRMETRNVDLDAEYASRQIDARPGPHVVLSVADTGTGMDEKALAHLFEPFFTTRSNGTGLGLSIVYGITRQAGGHVAIESVQGKGTTVRVYFPATA